MHMPSILQKIGLTIRDNLFCSFDYFSTKMAILIDIIIKLPYSKSPLWEFTFPTDISAYHLPLSYPLVCLPLQFPAYLSRLSTPLVCRHKKSPAYLSRLSIPLVCRPHELPAYLSRLSTP